MARSLAARDDTSPQMSALKTKPCRRGADGHAGLSTGLSTTRANRPYGILREPTIGRSDEELETIEVSAFKLRSLELDRACGEWPGLWAGADQAGKPVAALVSVREEPVELWGRDDPAGGRRRPASGRRGSTDGSSRMLNEFSTSI